MTAHNPIAECPACQAQEAVADITRVIHRYAEMVDRRRFDQVVECFTDDAEFILDGERQVISSLFCETEPESNQRTMHQVTNINIDVNGDHAVANSYVFVHRAEGAGLEEVQILIGASYEDIFERSGGRWRIKQRTLERRWSSALPVGNPAEA